MPGTGDAFQGMSEQFKLLKDSCLFLWKTIQTAKRDRKMRIRKMNCSKRRTKNQQALHDLEEHNTKALKFLKELERAQAFEFRYR